MSIVFRRELSEAPVFSYLLCFADTMVTALRSRWFDHLRDEIQKVTLKHLETVDMYEARITQMRSEALSLQLRPLRARAKLSLSAIERPLTLDRFTAPHEFFSVFVHACRRSSLSLSFPCRSDMADADEEGKTRVEAVRSRLEETSAVGDALLQDLSVTRRQVAALQVHAAPSTSPIAPRSDV